MTYTNSFPLKVSESGMWSAIMLASRKDRQGRWPHNCFRISRRSLHVTPEPDWQAWHCPRVQEEYPSLVAVAEQPQDYGRRSLLRFVRRGKKVWLRWYDRYKAPMDHTIVPIYDIGNFVFAVISLSIGHLWFVCRWSLFHGLEDSAKWDERWWGKRHRLGRPPP